MDNDPRLPAPSPTRPAPLGTQRASRLALVAVLLPLAACFPASDVGSAVAGYAADDAETLFAADQRWMALSAGDEHRRALEELLDDEFEHVFVDGRCYDKAYHLAEAPEPASLRATLEEQGVRTFGDTAITFGAFVARDTSRGDQIVARHRYTNVWVHDARGWRLVRSHWTRAGVP